MDFSFFLSQAKSVATFFFGTSSELLHMLVAVMVFDYLTGVCVAIHQKKLSSKVGFVGISRKVIMIFVISVSHAADEFLFDSSGALQSTTTLFYLVNECMSVLENAGKLGVPLPSAIKKALSKFQEDNNT